LLPASFTRSQSDDYASSSSSSSAAAATEAPCDVSVALHRLPLRQDHELEAIGDLKTYAENSAATWRIQMQLLSVMAKNPESRRKSGSPAKSNHFLFGRARISTKFNQKFVCVFFHYPADKNRLN